MRDGVAVVEVTLRVYQFRHPTTSCQSVNARERTSTTWSVELAKCSRPGRRGIDPSLQVLVPLGDDPGRITADHRIGRDVAGHDGVAPDVGSRADRPPRQDHRADAQERSRLDVHRSRVPHRLIDDGDVWRAIVVIGVADEDPRATQHLGPDRDLSDAGDDESGPEARAVTDSQPRLVPASVVLVDDGQPGSWTDVDVGAHVNALRAGDGGRLDDPAARPEAGERRSARGACVHGDLHPPVTLSTGHQWQDGPPMVPESERELVRRRCESVLRQNWREGTRSQDGQQYAFSCPSPGRYP